MSQVPMQSSGLRVPREALPASLQPYVEEVYEERIPEPPGGSLCFSVSATTFPCLNVTFGGKAWISLGDGLWMPPVILAGPQQAAYTATCHTGIHGFYVRFTSVGALALLGTRHYWNVGHGGSPDLHHYVRASLAGAACAYIETLFAAPDFAARAALTERFLLHALATAPPGDLAEAAFLQQAVDAIESSSGGLRVPALAHALHVSPSTLRRRFSALGMTVKRFAEVVRFRHAHAYLHTTPGATWADVVFRFGYADQPHFVREYRRFSGGPPTRWDPASHMIDLRMGIEGPDRLDRASGSP